MRIDVLTLFPDMVRDPLRHSIVARAISAGIADLHVHDLRDWTFDRRRSADDKPYGGGAGMVMKCEPLHAAISSLREGGAAPRTILLTPRGRVLTQALVLDPRRTSTWTPLAEALALAGHKEEALAALWIGYQWSNNREKSLAFYADRAEKERATRPALAELYGAMSAWTGGGTRPAFTKLGRG